MIRPPETTASIRQLLDDPLSRAVVEVAGSVDCHLVGGAIRDRLALGTSADDWDLIVDDQGEVIAQRLATLLGGRLVRLGGTRFSAYRIVSGPRVVDLWDRQRAPIEQELRRRDLTINSIALHLSTGEVVDPLGGCADIAAAVLRANAPERFIEDPLRTVRLLRFSQHLRCFRIEPATVDAARLGAPRLGVVAAERVRQELDRVLGRQLEGGFADSLLELDLFPRLWSTGSVGAAARVTTVFQAGELRKLIEASDRLGDWAQAMPAPRRDELNALHHAILILAASRAETDAGSAPNPRLNLDQLVERRWVGRSTADLVRRLIEPVPLPASEADRRLFVYRHRAAWPLVATMAALDASESERPAETLEALADLAAREGQTILHAKPLLNGHDLERHYGIEPGARMGSLLSALREAQAVGAVRTASEARQWVADRLSRSLDEPLT